MFLMFVFLFFCFTSLVGVFGDEVKSVMEGDSVTLHTNITEIKRDDVMEWRFGRQTSTIAKIINGINQVSVYADVLDGRFRDRLQLNDQTGDLTITNITTQHNGDYNVTITSATETSYRFNVIVYAHLPVPVITRDFSQCSSCVLFCLVLNMRDVSLSWYKGNSLLSSISVSDLNIRLSLPLEVEYQDNNTYSCVLNNPITNQTQHLNITQLCQMCSDTTGLTLILICSGFGFLMIVASVLIFWIYRKHKNTEQVHTNGEEITYADPTFCKRAAHKPRSAVEDDVVYAGVMRR
ncbi:SLAM family member 5-like [Paramisgurnus dabryanus]|uniref:SLAM family member 5-like n=1 Tax=Paramisgurnus dabryanus TaxID=90735 RepID=UPI0031F42603